MHLDTIKSLEPDLIIANKEENTKEQIEELQQTCEVLVTDIKSVDDNLKLIQLLGNKLNRNEEAATLYDALLELKTKIRPTKRATAIYLIWQKPYMTVGGDTFINNMLSSVGFHNLFANQNRYPETTIEDMRSLNPDFVLLSSEPFPFKEKHIEDLQNELPNAKILLVDGEAFSWYGSRIIKKAEYLKSIQTKIQTFAE